MPTSYRPYKRERQRKLPSKGADMPEKSTASPNPPSKTTNWPDPGRKGPSRLNGTPRKRQSMWERF